MRSMTHDVLRCCRPGCDELIQPGSWVQHVVVGGHERQVTARTARHVREELRVGADIGCASNIEPTSNEPLDERRQASLCVTGGDPQYEFRWPSNTPSDRLDRQISLPDPFSVSRQRDSYRAVAGDKGGNQNCSGGSTEPTSTDSRAAARRIGSHGPVAAQWPANDPLPIPWTKPRPPDRGPAGQVRSCRRGQ